jgi:DNA invertase Pin-like site-specific DNA recombinase
MASRKHGRAVLYVRALAHEALDDVARVREEGEAWAARHGVRVVDAYLERPAPEGTAFDELPEALLAAAALKVLGASVLLVPSRTRCGDASAHAILERVANMYGARVVAMDGTEAPADVVALRETLGAYHRTIARAHVKAASRTKRARGEFQGQVPWGYRRDAAGKLVPNPDEERVVAIVRHMRAQGFTYQQITDFLAEHGHVSRSGRPLVISAVYKLDRMHRIRSS